nr:carboxypeptidase regulatory-like domain-containing protein [Granulicella sp. WH15]
MLRRAQIFLGSVLLTVSLASAQTSGTIVGNVHDAMGAQVDGASITVTNIERNTSQTVISGEDGNYVVPFLPPGSYRVTVEKQGFQRQASPPTQIDVDQRARLDFALKVGSISESIEVTSAAPLIRSETAELGEVIGQKPIEALPLNGRNFAQLVYLVPGVTTGQQGENLSGQSTYNPRAASDFNALGAQQNSSGWLVDGIMDNEFTFNTVMVQPSVESISEFKVLTGVYSAEYGRGSGIVTTQTRSGTNQFHGEVFEYHRDKDLSARSYFNRPPAIKQNFIRNQFGAALGGPIWKDKAFFFMDYYGETQIQGNTFVDTVPTALERTGNFSELCAGNGGSLNADGLCIDSGGNPSGGQIYDPYSTTLVTVNGQATFARTPLANNVIPQKYLNAVGLTVASIYPLPQTGGLINNYTDSIGTTLNDNGGNIRVDYKVGSKDSMFGRYSYERFTGFSAKGQGGCCIRTPAGLQEKYNLGPYISGGQNTVLLAGGAVLSETHVFSPSWVNQFSIGYAHTNPLTQQSDYGLNGATGLGINGINFNDATSGIPTLTISGVAGAYTAINDGPNFLPIQARQTSYQIEDSVSWTRGSHSIKFGYRLVDDQASPFTGINTRGTLTFGLNLTNNPQTASGGDGLASLEMGLMANGTAAGATRGVLLNPYVLTTWEHAAYVQDDWKVTPRLSLNLGMRWDLITPYTEQKNRLTNFDMASLSLIYADTPGVSDTANVKTQYRNFGPRIGFSYDITGKGKTVVRGGYAISYFPQEPTGTGLLGIQNPWAVTQNSATFTNNYPTSSQLATSEPLLSQPFPVPTPVKPVGTAALIAANPSIIGLAYANQTPSFQSYTLNIEQQFLNDYLLEVAYAGSHSNHLLYCFNPQEVEPGPSSISSNSRVTIPGIASIRSINYCQNTNRGNYNGLNAKLTKRLSGGLSLIASYSYSKSLDYGGATNSGGAVGSTQTITNILGAYGPSGYNVPHRFVGSYVWELPFGRGRKFLGENRIASAIAGGWEFDGIATIQSGLPFTLTNMSSCPNNATNCWPDRIPGVSLKPAHQDYAHWFNAAAFAVPCQVALTATNGCPTGEAAYRFGTEGRGALRGPQTVNFDLSLARTFPIWRQINLMARLDAFNALNHPPMSFPNQTINSSAPANTSEAITSTILGVDPRDLQISAKINF